MDAHTEALASPKPSGTVEPKQGYILTNQWGPLTSPPRPFLHQHGPGKGSLSTVCALVQRWVGTAGRL